MRLLMIVHDRVQGFNTPLPTDQWQKPLRPPRSPQHERGIGSHRHAWRQGGAAMTAFTPVTTPPARVIVDAGDLDWIYKNAEAINERAVQIGRIVTVLRLLTAP